MHNRILFIATDITSYSHSVFTDSYELPCSFTFPT